jgi:hypothetical protein
MREFLEIIWNGGTGRRLPLVLAAASGQISARLPDVGARGDLVITPDASLVFSEREVSETVFTSSGLKTLTTGSGSSTVIVAQDVAALNIHFGFIQLAAIGRNRHRACVFEVTLTGAEEQAAFALLRDGGGSSHDRVLYFARRLQEERAEVGLPEIEVTKSYDRGYRGSMNL